MPGPAGGPRFNGAARWDKPVLMYTFIQASFRLFGRSVAAARLPVALQGAALILIVGFLVQRIAGAKAGALSAVILATTLGTQVFSRVAHPELGVVLMVTVAELLVVLWITTPHPAARLRIALLAGLSVGLGGADQGPGRDRLAVSGGRRGSGGQRRPRIPSRAAMRHVALAGITSLAVALPWYSAMMYRHGVAFLEEAVWRHNVSRFAGTAFVHESAPWFFIGPTLGAMFPWCAFVPVALWEARRRTQTPRDVLGLYMAAAAVTAFAFYSASASRLPHYALAVVPSLAILIALVVADDGRGAASQRHSGQRRSCSAPLPACLPQRRSS